MSHTKINTQFPGVFLGEVFLASGCQMNNLSQTLRTS